MIESGRRKGQQQENSKEGKIRLRHEEKEKEMKNRNKTTQGKKRGRKEKIGTIQHKGRK